MNVPHFTHDCKSCRFLGHVNGHDLYVCDSGGKESLLARYGNDGPEYTSTRVSELMRQIKENIPVRDLSHSWTMPYREYVVSDKALDYELPLLVALALVLATR